MARPKTYDRSEVLKRATELFVRKGYEGTHLQELVTHTGLNRFSLYKEFGGKEGLFQAALDAYLEILAKMAAQLERDPPGIENLRAFYATLLDTEFPFGCFAVNTIREKHVVARRAFTTIEQFVGSVEQSFRRNLVAAQAAGHLPRGADVDALAKFLTAFDMGLISYGLVSPDPADRARIVGVLDLILPLRGHAARGS